MEEALPSLSHKEFLVAAGDYQKSARVIDLVYVRDSEPGIIRIKKGKGFAYRFNLNFLTQKNEIERIRKLAIPPAWTDVWICPLDKGHIQATGFDLLRRKQYRYHALWSVLRSETKFHRLYEFGKSLPLLRSRLEEDLSGAGLTLSKVLATAISLMEQTFVRVGNSGYEKLYGSYGLTTLKDKHVQIQGDNLVFSFKGKKGVFHSIRLKNKRLAKTVKACRDIPGCELFQYYDLEGNRRSIDSGMVNDYIRTATEKDFTAKDFRTWAGSIQALQAFQAIGESLSESECKKNIISALDMVSKKLGNTRMVCKKYYVFPGLLRLYEERKLSKYLGELDGPEALEPPSGLAPVEEVLMKILKQA